MGATPLGISGSRAAAILGLSDYQTPVEVWQILMEERSPGFNGRRGYKAPVRPPDAELPAHVRWGWAFEDAICRLAVERHGAGTIVDREVLWTWQGGAVRGAALPDGFHAYISCHIDGRYTEGGALHEGKTTTSWNFDQLWGEPGTDRIPQSYQIQVQHQMLCTGAESAIVSVLVWPRRVDEWEAVGISLVQALGRGDEMEWHVKREDPLRPMVTPCLQWARALDDMGYFHQYTVPASPSLQAELVRAYAEWWLEYVVGEREPEPRGYDDIRRLCPAPKGTVVANEQAERWASEYREIGDEIGGTGRLSKRRDELRVLILGWMRSQDAAMDEETREKTVLRDQQGKKLAQWNGKVFRT